MSPVRRSAPAGRSVAGTSEGVLFGRYARLVGAPHCAPSLRSVAGLLLALALQSGLRGPPPPSLRVQRGDSHHFRASMDAAHARGDIAARERAERSSASSWFSRVNRAADAGFVLPRKTNGRALRDLEREARGVLGGAPAARARRLGAPARPNGGRARTLPRRGHPSPTSRDGCLERVHSGARDLTGACSAIG